MKNIKDLLNEAWTNNSPNRAISGNVLEVELHNDGNFFWHSSKDSDWEKNKFDTMKDWEIWPWENNSFVIKIGEIKNIPV